MANLDGHGQAAPAFRYHGVMNRDPLAQEVLRFWFGPTPRVARDVWFRKDAAFDTTVRSRFGGATIAALDGAYRDWTATPHGTLARVLLLDQFTRNVFRDTPRSFAGDREALAMSTAAVDAGHDRELDPWERWFLYLPFEHAEDRAAQERSIALYVRLRDEAGLAAPLEWAERHAAIVRRFGRYPHRNAILGRESTPEEIEFLREPGSRF
jgi:uncharacterized protein (DUF924 family)